MAVTDPAPVESGQDGPTVSGLIEEALVEIASRSNGGVILRVEAERIWDRMVEENPEGLLEWIQDQAIGLIRQLLQVRLAHQRSRARDAALGVKPDPDAPRPFDARIAVGPEDRWKAIGDMTRPDWQFVVDDRSARAKASLFDLALARLVMKRLPDDETKTREVLSESEFERLERSAQDRAKRSVASFGKR